MLHVVLVGVHAPTLTCGNDVWRCFCPLCARQKKNLARPYTHSSHIHTHITVRVMIKVGTRRSPRGLMIVLCLVYMYPIDDECVYRGLMEELVAH